MFERVKHFIAEDVVFHIHGDPSEIRFAGIHHGLEGFRNAIEIFFQTMEIPEEEKFDSSYDYFTDQDEVIILGKTMIHRIGQPRNEPKPISQLMKFRNGKLVHFEDRYDIGEANLGDPTD